MTARATLILLSLAGAAHAQTFTWASPLGGTWNDPAHWSPASIPNGTTHTALINLAGSYAVTLDSRIVLQGLSITNPLVTFKLDPDGHLRVGVDGISTSGTIRIFGTGFSTASLDFDVPGPLAGGGTIILGTFSSAASAAVSGATGNGYTITPGFTIRGVGVLEGNRINNGLILADTGGGPSLTIQGTTINSAVIKAIAPGIISLPNSLITQTATGEVTADAGTVVMDAGAISGGKIRSINGGSWNFGPGTTINLSNVTVEGPVNIRSGAAVQVATQALTVLGTLIVNSDQTGSATLTWTTAGTLSGPGTVLLNGPLTTSAGLSSGGSLLTVAAGANIVGTGRFIGNATIANGRIAPGPIEGGIGSISFGQALNLQLAKIDLEVAGPGASQVDTLIGTGSLDLHGILRINAHDGFIPVMGLDWEIIRGGTLTGAFDEVHLPAPVNGIGYTIRRIGPSFHLQTKCYVNCDESTSSPLLTVNDFQCFLNLVAFGVSHANCDGSSSAPILNANDFQCFLNLYAAGCS